MIKTNSIHQVWSMIKTAEGYFRYTFRNTAENLLLFKSLKRNGIIDTDAFRRDFSGNIQIALADRQLELLESKFGACPVLKGENLNPLFDRVIAFESERISFEKNPIIDFGLLTGRKKYPLFHTIKHELQILEKSSYAKLDCLSKPSSGLDNQLNPEDIPVVELSSNPGTQKPGILLICGAHGDELLPTFIAMEFIYFMLGQYTSTHSSYSKHSWIQQIFKKCSVYVVPVLNPDGYRWNVHFDRTWRKNRNRYPLLNCIGVDLNRNYPIYFGWDSETSTPIGEQFRGPYPLSEPETKGIHNFLTNHPNIVTVLDLHTKKGKHIYRPRLGSSISTFGSATRNVLARHNDHFNTLESHFNKGIREVSPSPYSTSSLGPNSGALDDYIYHTFSRLGLSIECSNRGTPDPSSKKAKKITREIINSLIHVGKLIATEKLI